MYETKKTTWIAGTVAGAALALGLMIAGEGYVRVAQTIAPYGADIVKLETVTVVSPKQRASAPETTGTASASAVGNASM